MSAPASATASATSSVCSRPSTVQGPAIRASGSSPPTRTLADLVHGADAVPELRGAELVRLEDRYDAVDAGRAVEPEALDALAVADRADRRSRARPAKMGGAARRPRRARRRRRSARSSASGFITIIIGLGCLSGAASGHAEVHRAADATGGTGVRRTTSEGEAVRFSFGIDGADACAQAGRLAKSPIAREYGMPNGRPLGAGGIAVRRRSCHGPRFVARRRERRQGRARSEASTAQRLEELRVLLRRCRR